MKAARKRIDPAQYLGREPLILAVLTAIAVVFFLAVSALSRAYEARKVSLARHLAADGAAYLKAGRYAQAVEDFRAALEYARGNDAYQLSLAEALMGWKRYDEAQSYLENLRDRVPDSGVANLDLARIAVKTGQRQQALRFYHNAIYGFWPGDEEAVQRRSRIELIDYLLSISVNTQADAELIELETSLGNNSSDQDWLGAMFARVEDQQRALAAYRRALKVDRGDAVALAGVGSAQYALGQYEAAQRHFVEALAVRPGDSATEQALKKTRMVLAWDPFRAGIRDPERNRIVLQAFQAAGNRLKMCTSPDEARLSFEQEWTKLKPNMTDRGLRQQPELVNTAMNLVFSIERQTLFLCGPSDEADDSLLLVADLYEEE